MGTSDPLRYSAQTIAHLEAEIRTLISHARHHNALGQTGLADHAMGLVAKIEHMLSGQETANQGPLRIIQGGSADHEG